LTLDVKKSNSSNETPNVMTVGVENYGLRLQGPVAADYHLRIAPRLRLYRVLNEPHLYPASHPGIA
jgi:hypothetical protein